MSEKRVFCTAGCPSVYFTAKQVVTREVFVSADRRSISVSDPEKILSRGEPFEYVCDECGAPGELREVPDGYWKEFYENRWKGK